MGRLYDYERAPKTIKLMLPNIDWVPELNSVFVGEMEEHMYLSGRIINVETEFIDSKEVYFVIIKCEYIIFTPEILLPDQVRQIRFS